MQNQGFDNGWENTSRGMFSQYWWNHSLHLQHSTMLPLELFLLFHGWQHKQYTFTTSSLWCLLRDARWGTLDLGNSVNSLFWKHVNRCFLSCHCSNLARCGSRPLQRACANTMLKTPQSFPPLWRCTSTKRMVKPCLCVCKMATTCWCKV